MESHHPTIELVCRVVQWGALAGAVVVILLLARAWVVKRRGGIACPNCGYNLEGLTAPAADRPPTCPECGVTQGSLASLKRPTRWKRHLLSAVIFGGLSWCSSLGAVIACNGVLRILPDWALIKIMDASRGDRWDELGTECEYRLAFWNPESGDPIPLLRAWVVYGRPIRESWPVSEDVYASRMWANLRPRCGLSRSIGPTHWEIEPVPVPDKFARSEPWMDRDEKTPDGLYDFKQPVLSDVHGNRIFFQAWTNIEQPSASEERRPKRAVFIIDVPVHFVESVDEVIKPLDTPELAKAMRDAGPPSVWFDAQGPAGEVAWNMPAAELWPRTVACAFSLKLRHGDLEYSLADWVFDEPYRYSGTPPTAGLWKINLEELSKIELSDEDTVVLSGGLPFALYDSEATAYWTGSVSWPARQVFRPRPPKSVSSTN